MYVLVFVDLDLDSLEFQRWLCDDCIKIVKGYITLMEDLALLQQGKVLKIASTSLYTRACQA